MKTTTQLEALNSIRKAMPPPSKSFKTKKDYNRRDKGWQKEI